MDMTARTPARTEERGQVALTVLVVEEAGATIVAALDDMQRLTSHHGAWACHARFIRKSRFAYVIQVSLAGAIYNEV